MKGKLIRVPRSLFRRFLSFFRHGANIRLPRFFVKTISNYTTTKTRLLKRLIPTIGEVLSAGELEPPKPPEDAVEPAFADPPSSGDEGHRG